MVFVQPQAKNQAVRGLTQSLMTQRSGVPAYGAGGAIANFGAPVLAALLSKQQGQQQQQQQQAQTSAMGRLLAAAQKARASGQNPMTAVNQVLQANQGQPGYAAAGGQFMQNYQQNLAKTLAAPTAAPQPPKTREVKKGNEIVTQQWNPQSGTWTEIARSPRKAGIEVKNVLPKKVTEVQGTVEEIERLRAKGDPKSTKIADKLEMNLTFGGKPPVDYVKARGALGDAREGISETYRMIAAGQANPLSPKDRASVKQSINKARLAYAQMLNRGANFTESEQAMIDAILGGDPNDVINRALRGDQSYLDALERAGTSLERRGQQMIQAFTSPGVGTFDYPWQGGEGMTEAAAPAQSPAVQAPRRLRFDAEGNLIP